MRRTNFHIPGVLFSVLMILMGAGMMLYPFISNSMFEHRSDSLISVYEQEAESLDDAQTDALWQAAEQYNEALRRGCVQLTDPFDAVQAQMGTDNYESLLSVGSSGIMTYIEIPSIGVYLPVYHGTSPAVLEQGVGHLEGSSLPVGGVGTHCVLSGHTGLNRAKLFTDLPDLEPGDHFYLHTLGKTLAYAVDQILVVEPYDVSALQIENGEDYVTLVTCTPYGVNTHRLLVRGVRVPYAPKKAEQEAENAKDHKTAPSRWMQEYRKALVMGFMLVLLLFLAGTAVQKWREHSEKRR